MPADPIHPDQLGGEQRFRADLAADLDSLPVPKLAELLGELPSSRQQPLQLGVLMVAVNERLPDAYKLLPPAGHAGPGESGAARYGRWWPTAAPPAPAVTPARHPPGWPRGWPTTAAGRPARGPGQTGAVVERRVAEAPRTRATDSDPPPEPPDREREEVDFGDGCAPTGSAPATSARPTAGRYRSRHAPRAGCPGPRRPGARQRPRGSLTFGAPSHGQARHGAGACCCPSRMTRRPELPAGPVLRSAVGTSPERARAYRERR
jgi:hypothetical protein